MTFRTTSRSEDATLSLASSLGARLRPGDLVAIDGPLGAGKTCFVRGLATGMGVDPRMVASPSYTLATVYAGAGNRVLVHVDAWRMDGEEDLREVGWDEMLDDGVSVVAVEWSSRIGGALPSSRIEVCLGHASSTERDIEITAPPELEDRLRDMPVSPD